MLYVSTHQFPFYPGTGAADEIGGGAGAGFTVNVPLEAGATDEDYQRVFAQVVRAGAAAVRAGSDPRVRGVRRARARSARRHARDDGGFGAMTPELRAVADECCGGRIVSVPEGGYDLEALAASLDAGSRCSVRPADAAGVAGLRHQPRATRGCGGRSPKLRPIPSRRSGRFSGMFTSNDNHLKTTLNAKRAKARKENGPSSLGTVR